MGNNNNTKEIIEKSADLVVEKEIAKSIEKSFTQKEVNKIIAEQKRKFNKNQEDLLNELGVGRLEELKDKIDKLTKEIKLYKLKELKQDALDQAGLSSEYLDFIQGDEIETIKENIFRLVNVLDANKIVEVSVNPEKKPIRQNEDFNNLVTNSINNKGE